MMVVRQDVQKLFRHWSITQYFPSSYGGLSRHTRAMNRQRGYTLIETLITLTLVLILSAGGLYGWQSWQQQQRLWQTASQVRDYLVLLRDDANWHNRNRLVSVGQSGGVWCLSAEGYAGGVCGSNAVYAAAALAGSGAQPHHAGIRFYGLRNSAWAGHIRLQSAGELEYYRIWLGANSPVPQRGERIVPLIPRGFSLAETLISMAISAILLMGASRFLPALQRQTLRQTQQQSLDNELWQRVYTVAKHLQRAGYCAGECGTTVAYRQRWSLCDRPLG
jgi:prepilin peptidase dependent protein A